MNARYAVLVITLCTLVTGTACAQASATVFVGYAVSEGIDNATSGERARVASSVTFGIAADYDLDSSRQLQLFYGQQNT
ncbi:MAG TPA: hypothetical protein VES91_04650, partial [Burkholderiaceae bacterium]|nr:hypothetical protein [Burkholderiaceae bacterium]